MNHGSSEGMKRRKGGERGCRGGGDEKVSKNSSLFVKLPEMLAKFTIQANMYINAHSSFCI